MQDAKKKVNEKLDKFKSAIQHDAPWPLSSLSVATLGLFKISARGVLVFMRG
jgi:hypothetical protein